MRTNIDLDDALLDEASQYSSARSKKDLVKEALATYVAVKREERQRRSYQERLQRIRIQTAHLRGHADAQGLIRRDRDTR